MFSSKLAEMVKHVSKILVLKHWHIRNASWKARYPILVKGTGWQILYRKCGDCWLWLSFLNADIVIFH